MPGGRVGISTVASEFTWVRAPAGSTSSAKKFRTMLTPRRDRDSWRIDPGRLASSAFHAGGDSRLDAGRGHAVIKRQHLNGRAAIHRQDVGRNRGQATAPAKEHGQHQNGNRPGIPSEKRIRPFMDQAVSRSRIPGVGQASEDSERKSRWDQRSVTAFLGVGLSTDSDGGSLV